MEESKNTSSSNVTSITITISAVFIVFVIALGFIINNIINSIHYEDYDLNAYIAADEHNGYIGDHIKGNPDAPVVIVEYADFQCPLCATLNPLINQTVEDSNGQLAIIYRNYSHPYHLNATAAATAAEAAGLQGYWQPYADKLFLSQDEWGYVSAAERTVFFKKYFTEVTDGKGDLEKFEQDLSSPDISKKLNFDMSIAKHIDFPGTPALYVDGNYIDWSNSEGSSVTVNYRTIVWDSAIAPEGVPGLLLKIVEAKLEPNE